MNVALAFLRRDALIWSSYRMALAWQLLGICVFIGIIYFLGTALGDTRGLFGGQSTSFVAFVLSGITFTDVMMQGLHAIPLAIRENQKDGTLEPMLLAPVATISLAISSSLFGFVLAFGRMLIYLGFAVVVLGFWHQADVLSLLVVIVSATLGFVALGVLSASFVIVLKQGDPILVAYGAVNALLSGVLFPVSVLPGWIQPLANLVPLTYALAGLRAALAGAPPSEVIGPVLVLGGMAAVLFPCGIVAFNWAVNRAKREGSLGQY